MLLRTVLDSTTGDLSDTRTRYLGTRPVKLFAVKMQGRNAVSDFYSSDVLYRMRIFKFNNFLKIFLGIGDVQSFVVIIFLSKSISFNADELRNVGVRVGLRVGTMSGRHRGYFG